MSAPPRVTLSNIRRSDTGAAQRAIDRTLATQKILDKPFLGDKLRPSSASRTLCSSGTDGPLTSFGMEPIHQPWTEGFQRGAREEKETALKLQKEQLQAQFRQALRARERLEAEARRAERVGTEARLEARYGRLKERTEEEKRREVEEACRRVREEMRREAELEKEEQRRIIQKEMEEHVKERVSAAEQRVGKECKNEAEKERRSLQDKHKEELSQLQDRLRQLQDSLAQVCWERRQYEAEFKKVQASYRQFIDLTDSSLHSDYLLTLRRLGKEPGLVQAATQTDDTTTTTTSTPAEHLTSRFPNSIPVFK